MPLAEQRRLSLNPDPRGESPSLITAQRRSAAFEGSTLRVRRRSTLDRAGNRDSSTAAWSARSQLSL